MQMNMKKSRFVCFLVMSLLVVVVFPCIAEEDLETQVLQTVERFQNAEPRTAELFENAYGYVVFPRIEKGALVVGGAYGEGLVYENQTAVAMAEIRHITVGVQAGGGTYAEVIFFDNEETMAPFREGDVIASGQAQTFGPHDSLALNKSDRPGMSIFTLNRTGGFLEASVGTEQVRFLPLEQ
jgi:lipid-binding SYLF domain-containing protein